MRLVTYRRDHAVRHGRLADDRILELGDGDLSALFQRSPSLAGSADRVNPRGEFPLDSIELLQPLIRPGKVLAVAANYQQHVDEGGGPPLDKSRLAPRLFLKPVTAITGPDTRIPMPAESDTVDWEAELVVVVGRRAKNLRPDETTGAIAGYANGNDISARTVDYGYEREEAVPGASPGWFFDWLAGKWFDSFAPFGPYLVTADEIQDPQDLDIRLEVNGKARQLGNTRDMLFTVTELVAFASRLTTLEPGDLIYTGTPAGVGDATGEYLVPGDEVSVTIEHLGQLVNTIAEAD